MKPADDLQAEFARLLPQLDTRNWTASEHAAFFGMFAHGWYGRADEAAYQRAAEQPYESVQARFVIFIPPGQTPQTKGSFSNDDQVEQMLIGMKAHYPPSTKYIVAEIAYGPDLWVSSAKEFLTLQEVARMPDGDDESE